MTSPRDPDRMIHAFLLEGEEELHDQVYDAVRAVIEQKPHRAGFGPWREFSVNKFLAIGLGAAAVVAVLLIGSNLLGSGSPAPGGAPSPSVLPSQTPSEAPSEPAASAPPLTQSFTSTLHGITVSYPEGWITQAATEPWTDSTFPLNYEIPQADYLHHPGGFNLFLTFASQPIGDSTPEDWSAEQIGAPSGDGCTESMPVTVDGATGLIGVEGCDVAVVTTAGRGYWIQLYTSSDDPAAVAPYDREWFEEFLATVDLHPEDAVD